MATKKIDPKNPDATKKQPNKKATGNVTGRKASRKTNSYARGFSDRAMKTGIVSVEW